MLSFKSLIIKLVRDVLAALLTIAGHDDLRKQPLDQKFTHSFNKQ